MVDHSTLFFLKNLFFQLIHGLTWKVDVIKILLNLFCSKLLIVSQMQILGVKDVVWGGSDVVWCGLVVVWGGFGLTWQAVVMKMILNLFFNY